MLAIVLPLITAPYISRTLGASGVGIYSYTYSVASYFLLMAMLGISNHGNRSIASVRDDYEQLSKTFWSIYAFQFFMFIISLIIYFVYILFVVKDNQIIALLQTFYILSGLFDISWLFFGLEKFKLTVIRNTLIKIATVVLMFVFVKNPHDLWKYTLIMAVGTFLSQAYLWLYIRKYTMFIKFNEITVKAHIKPIIILLLPVIAYSIYKITDKIMLGSMSTYTQLGYYDNSLKIINIPMGIIIALGTVMLPRMSNIIAKGDTEKINYYINNSIKFVTILGSVIAFGLIGVSNILAPVYFGSEFTACAPLITLLSVTVFFTAWANVIRTQYLIPNKYDNIYIISTFVGAILNLMINMTLIPHYGSKGAAIGTIVAEFSVMAVQVFAVRKKLSASKYILSCMPIIFIGAVMAIVVRLIGQLLGANVFTLVLQVLVGGIIYCLMLGGYLYLKKDEMYLLAKDTIKKNISKHVKNRVERVCEGK